MPQIKGAPVGLNKILESAYQSCMKDNGDAGKCSKIAYGAASKAGWKKEGDRWVKHPEGVDIFVEDKEVKIPEGMQGYEEYADDGRPEKSWWDKCIAVNKDKVKDVSAYCGFLWHRIVKGKGAAPAKVLEEDHTEEFEEKYALAPGDVHVPTAMPGFSIRGWDKKKKKYMFMVRKTNK